MNKSTRIKEQQKPLKSAYAKNSASKKKRHCRSITACALSLILLCCKKSVFHTDTFFMTIHPSVYLTQENALSWLCEYADNEGRIIEIPIDNTLADIVIEVPIHAIFPVRFRLRDSVSVLERCLNNQHFGMIVPFSEEMQIAESAASDIFFKVLTSSYNNPDQTMGFCRTFNWQRLIDYLRKYEDPYALDLDSAAADIARGTFTSKSLKTACLK
ncbi:MAG: hypothetical protein KA785_05230 [Spirochaetaceae bacterium]|nr:hypothetical protein [Spirochaetaceae bacterium]